MTEHVTFDAPDVAASFAVNTGQRTISGLLMPWGQVGRSGYTRYKFTAGSLHWSDVARVKLYRDHDYSQPLGVATDLRSGSDGLHATFRVARGAAGDELLSLAEDGVIDGLSAGVEFAEGADWSDDPVEQGVRLVNRAILREGSATARPAFDSARLTSVAATREGNTTMTEQDQAVELAAQPAVPVQLNTEPVAPLPVLGAEDRRPVPAGRFVSADVQHESRPQHPLGYTDAALTALQAALDTRSPGRFVASDPEASFATLTTSTIGSPRAWGANRMRDPRLLHLVGGVPRQEIAAVFAEFPQLTLPTAAAAAAEGAAMVEYASSAKGSVTLGRFGRWTDLSREGLVGADAQSITQMHRLGIALDMDQVLVNATEAAAGAAVGFNSDVPGQIRKAMAQVMANTATDDPADLTILVNPADIALLQDVSPIGGSTMGERFQRFSGAVVYPTTAADAGFMTVANLSIGARYFEAVAMETLTLTDPKTGVQTVGTFVICGYGVTLTTGFAVKQDVVTP